MRYRGALGWLIGLTVMLAVPSAALGATVTSTADSGAGSLRDAIAASQAGDTINFDPSLNGQTITLTGTALPIDHTLTISGPGAGNLTIDGGNLSSVFNINPPIGAHSSVTVSGLTITGGKGGDPGGGGIFANNNVGSLTLTGDNITGNQASVRANNGTGGGGVYVDGGALVISNSTITHNQVAFPLNEGNGGGGGVDDHGGTVTVTGSDISHNTVTNASSLGFSGGGGVYSDGGAVDVSNSTVLSNSVQIDTATDGFNGGGGIYSNGGGVSLSGSTVSGNSFTVMAATATGFNGGGGVYENGGAVALNATAVSDNSVVQSSSSGFSGGGGIYSNGGGVSLGQATLHGNSFTLSGATSGFNGGGGAYENGGDVSVISSSVDANGATVTDNSSGSDGGGGLFSNNGVVGVIFSSVSNNSGNVTTVSGAGDGGGGIFDENSRSVYHTSTFSGNSMTISSAGSETGGGAIHTLGAIVINLTIADNSTNRPGGAILSDGNVQFRNTIIADNTATPAGNCTGGNGFSSAGFNLESSNTCNFNATGDRVNTEPHLGPLQNNGGPTPTRAPATASPAIDTGSCTDIVGNPLTTDQRGIARPQPAGGKCDIGAYELIPAAPPPPPPPAKPAAVPGKPAAISTTGAAFSSTVNPEGQTTTVVFQYGIDARFRPGGGSGIVYDQSTQPQTLPADSTNHPVTAAVTGLVPNALYHMRVVATNATGTTVGPDQTFTTPADPPPPPPVLAKNVDAKPVSGKVFLLVGGTLVPLTEADQLRAGTVVDTRNGSLQLTTASSQKHKQQTGTFGGAIFKITQVRSGLTTLSLVENALKGAPSFASCKSKKGKAFSAAVSSKTLQLLHSSAKGKFRTKGRYAAATVRGTKWTIADRCDGTLTHDLTDSVIVNDFVRHKTIVLHAGHSYLALAQPPKKKKKK